MQNSAWKLTALAGVIGLGFLIVVQAQRNMDEGDGGGSPSASADTGEESAPKSDGEEDQTLLSLNSEPGTEATPDSEETASTTPVPDYANRPTLATDLGRASPFAPADTDFADTDFAGTDRGITTVSAEEPVEEFSPFESLPSEVTSPLIGETEEPVLLSETTEEVPPSADSAAEPAPFLLSEPDATSLEATETGSEPAANPFARLELEPAPETTAEETEDAAKTRALELVAAARKAMDSGELDSARELARAALEMPVSYTPLDDRPETVLREIDQLLKFQNLPATVDSEEESPTLLLTGGEAEEDPFGTQPFAPQQDKTPPADPPFPGSEITTLDGNPATEATTEGATEPDQPLLPFGTEETPPPETVTTEPESAFETDPFGSAPATTTVKTEASGSLVTSVTGDGTIPEDGPEPALKPELTIEKIAPPEAILDKPMVYSINVTNRGNATAAQLVVEDLVPKGCRLIGTRPQAVMVGTKLIWRLGTLPAGHSEKILVKVVPITAGEVGSVATVSFVTEVAARTDVRTSADSTLQLTVEAPRRVAPGETVVMKFRVKNNSSQDAINVKLQDIIPPGLEHETGADLTYDIGTIKAGTTFSADLELKAVKTGKFTNQATITAEGGLRSEAVSDIEILSAPGISLQTIPGKAVLVGQKTVHSTRVVNESQTDADQFTVTSRLPDEVQFLSATENGEYDATSHSVQWQFSGLAAGRSLVLQTSLQARTYGTHTALTQLTQPGIPVSKVESQLVVQGIAAMAIDLEDVPATVLANDEFTVNATVLNRGSGPDFNVQLALILPDGVEFVDSRGPVRLQRQPITLTSTGPSPAVTSTKIPEIGEKASVDFQITLRASKPGRPKIRAQVSSTQLSDPVATEAAIVVIDDAP